MQRVVACVTVFAAAWSRAAAQTTLLTCDPVVWSNAAGPPTTSEDFSSFHSDISFHGAWLPLAFGRVSDHGVPGIGWNMLDSPPFASLPPPNPPPITYNGTQHLKCRVDATTGLQVRFELDRRAAAFGAWYGDAHFSGGEELELVLYDGALQVGAGAITNNANCPIQPAPNYTFFGVVSSAPFDALEFRGLNNLPGLVGQTFTVDDVAVVDAVCWMATSTYCTAGTSQHGCVPTITYSGLPSATATSGFVISISGADGLRNGFVFYGIGNAPVSPLSWGVGSTSYQCLLAPTQRLQPATTGGNLTQCDGAFASDWNAFVAAHATALGAPFAGGEEIRAQAWIRDPNAVKNACLSNALHFQVCP